MPSPAQFCSILAYEDILKCHLARWSCILVHIRPLEANTARSPLFWHLTIDWSAEGGTADRSSRCLALRPIARPTSITCPRQLGAPRGNRGEYRTGEVQGGGLCFKGFLYGVCLALVVARSANLCACLLILKLVIGVGAIEMSTSTSDHFLPTDHNNFHGIVISAARTS